MKVFYMMILTLFLSSAEFCQESNISDIKVFNVEKYLENVRLLDDKPIILLAIDPDHNHYEFIKLIQAEFSSKVQIYFYPIEHISSCRNYSESKESILYLSKHKMKEIGHFDDIDLVRHELDILVS